VGRRHGDIGVAGVIARLEQLAVLTDERAEPDQQALVLVLAGLVHRQRHRIVEQSHVLLRRGRKEPASLACDTNDQPAPFGTGSAKAIAACLAKHIDMTC